MNVFTKFCIWIISFPVAFVLVTIMSLGEYLMTLFDMPVDVWNTIDEAAENAEP